MPTHPGAEWLQKHWHPSVLPNNEWVAATGQQLIAHDPSLANVIAGVRDQHYSLEDVTFAFVSFDRWQ